MECEDAHVALKTAIAALHAVGNLMMTLAEIAQQAGAPSEAILGALMRYQEANDDVIAHADSKRLLAKQVQVARGLFGPNTH